MPKPASRPAPGLCTVGEIISSIGHFFTGAVGPSKCEASDAAASRGATDPGAAAVAAFGTGQDNIVRGAIAGYANPYGAFGGNEDCYTRFGMAFGGIAGLVSEFESLLVTGGGKGAGRSVA